MSSTTLSFFVLCVKRLRDDNWIALVLLPNKIHDTSIVSNSIPPCPRSLSSSVPQALTLIISPTVWIAFETFSLKARYERIAAAKAEAHGQ